MLFNDVSPQHILTIIFEVTVVNEDRQAEKIKVGVQREKMAREGSSTPLLPQ